MGKHVYACNWMHPCLHTNSLVKGMREDLWIDNSVLSS
jgi:hypothetical protein